MRQVGSSHPLIEQEARGCASAFVLEAGAGDGALQTSRKGTSIYSVDVTGRSAHAGLEPERGVNAAVELADPWCGTTVTPTLLHSGHTANTVPAAGSVGVDVRVQTAAEQVRVDAAIRAVPASVPGPHVTVIGGPNRPPLPPTASAALFDLTQALAARLDLDPLQGSVVVGASDGNFTAGVGVPTLDGPGAVGGCARQRRARASRRNAPSRGLLAGLVAAVLERPTGDEAGIGAQR